MAIRLPNGFNIGSVEPIDSRLILTKAEMLSINDNIMPDKYICVCKEDGKLYIYEKDRTGTDISTVTGKFKPYGAYLADNDSTIYLDDQGKLSLKGYNKAEHGFMLVKDKPPQGGGLGLSWVKPLDSSQLDAAVAQATAQATQAGAYAITAGNSAADASASAGQAQRINEQTMAWVNEKFWWGTIEEYNKLTEINEGTFYFVQL